MRDDFAELRHRVQQEGLLEKQPVYYLLKFALNFALVAVGVVIFARFRSPWVQALNAAFLGFVSIQFAYLMHDAGHRQMFHKAWHNDVAGLIAADLMVGIAFGWWAPHHNDHHANPNHAAKDPDLDMLQILLALTEGKARQSRGLARLIIRYQAYLFVFMFLVQGFGLKGLSYLSLAQKKTRYRWLEVVILAVHYTLYLGLLLHYLGPWSTVLVVTIQHMVAGAYMASCLAPNHMGLPLVYEDLDFMRAQIIPSRNVKAGSFMTDIWFGGLNYQIEHHLFPAMSRNKILRSREVVKPFCEERGIPYKETSMGESYREILADLYRVGAATRAEPRAE